MVLPYQLVKSPSASIHNVLAVLLFKQNSMTNNVDKDKIEDIMKSRENADPVLEILIERMNLTGSCGKDEMRILYIYFE